MRYKLGERRYRIVLTVAVLLLAILTAGCWWLIPVLWKASPVARVAGVMLVAVLFAVVILLIWGLHSDHSRH